MAKGIRRAIPIRWLSQSWPLILLWILYLFASLPPAKTQSQLSDVKVAPQPKSLARKTIPNSSLRGNSEPLKVNVNLVLVPVTVTDGLNHTVLGLEKQNFQVYENKHLQSIQTFSSTDIPVSIGIIFDTSGSMATKLDRAREAVKEFINTANPEDEFFMITFADEPRELVDLTTSPEQVLSSLLLMQAKGSTALLDAVYMGISKMQGSKYNKKALLVISDGGDNHSRYSEKDVKRMVKETDVMIYAIGIYDRSFPTEEERLGPELLSDISELTGGRTFTIDDTNDLPDVACKIGVELRNQYVLGYRPSETVSDGKWHTIKVKLLPPKGLPQLLVHTKQGYYAREE
jgi:Ca-activated chloride channel homolog